MVKFGLPGRGKAEDNGSDALPPPPPPVGGGAYGGEPPPPYRMRLIQQPLYVGEGADSWGGPSLTTASAFNSFGVSPVPNPDKYGVMKKRREHNKGWKTRWVILKNHMLFYYENDPMALAAKGKDGVPKGIIWYHPDEVSVHDDGTGEVAIHLQQPSGEAFLLSSDDPAEIEEWARVLQEMPPDLRRAMDELERTKAELLAARRELRNQRLEMEQIEEELAHRNRLVDLEAELKELLQAKNTEIESLMAQLRDANRQDYARSSAFFVIVHGPPKPLH
eukprot:SAG11_NODE_3750_length_2251_cov_1.509758_1_plen_277_part_00